MWLCECINLFAHTHLYLEVSLYPTQAVPLSLMHIYSSFSLLAANNVLTRSWVGSVLLTITLDTHFAEFDSDNTLTLVRLMTQYFISLNKLNNI